MAFAQADLSELDKNILEGEIELANIVNSQQANLNHPEKRNRRTFIYDISNAMSTGAGLIGATALFWKYSYGSKQNRIKGVPIEQTLEPQIVGQFLGLTGCTLELFGKSIKWLKNHKTKREQKIIVQQLEDKISNLLTERRNLKQDNSSVQLEQKVLENQYELLSRSYLLSRDQSKRNTAYECGEDTVGCARNIVGAIGNILNVQAIHTNNRFLNANGSVLSAIAASGIIVLPWVAISCRKSVGEPQRKISFTDLEELKSTSDQLEKESLTPSQSTKLKACRAIQNALNYQIELYTRRVKHDQTMMTEEIIRNDIYGSTKLAETTMSVVVNARMPHSPNLNNRLNGAANTIYTSGQGVNISELLRERFTEERQLHQWKKQNRDSDSLSKESQNNIDKSKQLIHLL